ncbi:MAG: carbohydrate ABC transporter permease [Candidatus Sulfotelmatobacter sp.]
MKSASKWIRFVVGWAAALWIFFPILWMLLTSLKSEPQAYAAPPVVFFRPTLENFRLVLAQSSYARYALNSVYVSCGATVFAMILSIPAAYAMAFRPGRRTKSLLVWIMSTKMMPPVSALVPVYLILGHFALLDSVASLIAVFAMSNLPIVLWLVYSYFCEVPHEILEAGRMDGMTPWQEIRYLLLQMSLPGLASTALLSIVLCWNETFWSINLTSAKAGPLTVFIATFSNPEGLFLAKLSAASILAIAPILVFGWIAQKQLVRGLTFGAVK